MSASTKRSRGRHVKDMHQLKAKISTLQSQYQQLAQQRQEDIASLLSWVDLTSVEDTLLMGAFLFVKDQITTKDSTGLALTEAWQDAGEKFLRRTKSKPYSQVPSAENKSSKQTTAVKAMSQSPQKQLESGGK